MLILALDTTSEVGGVGIYRDAERLAWVPNHGHANEFSVTLFEMVDQALAQAQLELRQMELYAVANGPGSFTGIRSGMAAARAWGEAFERPVRAVSVLQAMLGQVRLSTDWAFPILDARRGEFFLRSFRRTPASALSTAIRDYEPAGEGWVLDPEALERALEARLASGQTATCVVRAHDQAAANLRARLPATLAWQTVEGALVDSIAAIARQDEQSAAHRPDTALDAYYLRRPDAETNWKE
jgi:tRNA threonylcarbamoyladenosine biosynthesis protein TsaB